MEVGDDDARERRAFFLERVVVYGIYSVALVVTLATLALVVLAVAFVVMMNG